MDLPDPEIKFTSPTLAGGFLTTEPPGKSYGIYKRTMSVHTKEEALALATVDTGGKHRNQGLLQAQYKDT